MESRPPRLLAIILGSVVVICVGIAIGLGFTIVTNRTQMETGKSQAIDNLLRYVSARAQNDIEVIPALVTNDVIRNDPSLRTDDIRDKGYARYDDVTTVDVRFSDIILCASCPDTVQVIGFFLYADGDRKTFDAPFPGEVGSWKISTIVLDQPLPAKMR